ncbi:DHA2 family multidrug resistance protein-like MFS transporter [Bacillus oleivorans]|uniref:DHA2 family multidrug resistance protein-like MFS transporter n=1 Tax=Bacillus oleivorans TaxID=1448271 RepID=A0A285CPE4_9BACI|nr:MFS transporter [Bacillus oleivorans]SNX68843.1 DHA2 family multidrug resistance protein-like MFS transporter [Bacillus oleivorans]
MTNPMTGSNQQAGIREWIGLAVLVLASLLVAIDLFVLVLALPYLSADLGASSIEQLWIMDIYVFMVAGFLITMGTLGDRIGRRKLLLIGAATFGIGSLIAAFSTSPEMLIGARALLGVSGATLAPSTLALISNMFISSSQRAVAISIWMVGAMVGAAIGPLVGGVMLENFWWGSVFLLGVPAMVLLLLLGPFLLPEYRDTNAGRIDLASVFLSLAAIFPIIYGIKELSKDGWQTLSIVAIIFGLIVSAIFIRRQRALSDPLLDLHLFSSRTISTALGGQLFVPMLMGVIMLLVTQYLQLVEGLTPLRTALWMLPVVAAQIISFMMSPILARRIRPAYLIGAGLTFSVTGLLLLTQVNGASDFAILVTGYALTNFGGGPIMTLSTDMIVGSAPSEKAGLAGAMSQTSAEFGFALGLAVLGSIGTAVYRNQIADNIPVDTPPEVANAARDTLVGATEAAQKLSDPLGTELLAIAREAFTSGMNTVATVSAIMLIGVSIFTVLLLRHILPSGATHPEQDNSVPASATSTDQNPS